MTDDRQTLAVPGATLSYRVRGSGPVLLLIPGGPADAAGFDGVAAALASEYRVVTYDPRGLSRSTWSEPGEQLPVARQAEDASRLLAAVCGSPNTEPAYVLGSSGGAVTGLELVTRYPDQVRLLVAHEPPVTELLPDAAEHRAAVVGVVERYRSEGVLAGVTAFLAHNGLDVEAARAREAGAPVPGSIPARHNFDLFFASMIVPIIRYEPDLDALRALSGKVVVAGGTTTTETLAYRTATALAERLGTPLRTFPGGHSTYVGDPAPFADTLHDVLSGASAS